LLVSPSLFQGTLFQNLSLNTESNLKPYYLLLYSVISVGTNLSAPLEYFTFSSYYQNQVLSQTIAEGLILMLPLTLAIPSLKPLILQKTVDLPATIKGTSMNRFFPLF
jgi:hypothetical protein